MAMLVSALVALLLLILVAWMTSGSWSPSRVRWQDLVLVLPVLLAVKLGLSHVGALVVTFFTYWAIGIALMASYIRATGLEVRAPRKVGHED